MSFTGMLSEDGWVLGSSFTRLCGRLGLRLCLVKAARRLRWDRRQQALPPAFRRWSISLGRDLSASITERGDSSTTKSSLQDCVDEESRHGERSLELRQQVNAGRINIPGA